MSFTLQSLEQIIASRSFEGAEKSYTKSLLDRGSLKVAKKFGEEAVELVIAASTHDSKDVVYECADVVYHMLVLLKSQNIALQLVVDELERRTTQSGHEEKAARS